MDVLSHKGKLIIQFINDSFIFFPLTIKSEVSFRAMKKAENKLELSIFRERLS